MQIIAWGTLREFVVSRIGRRDQQALNARFDEIRKVKCSNTADAKRFHAFASIASQSILRIELFGSSGSAPHRNYDRVDVKEVNLE
jgi:hypothetical protein